MGAMYSEDDELDFTFLRQSVRQQPRGAAPGQRPDERERDRMADLVWGSRKSRSERTQSAQAREAQGRQAWGDGKPQAQAASGRQRQAVQTADRQLYASQGSGSQRKAGQVRSQQPRTSGTADARDSRRQGQSRPGQAAQNRSRSGQAAAKRPQTMQEKQSQRQAALLARKRRRLRRQKQLLAILLGILLAGSGFAVLQLRQLEAEPGVEAESGGQSVTQMQAEGSIDNVVLGTIQGIPESQYNQHPDWTEDYLTISEYSRPGEPLTEVNNIFVHYTANPNTSAAQNRSYFENLKDNHDVPGASAHFIIGINGEILQIVPLDEIAYAVQTRNQDSISIECCYKNKNGQFTQETYDSLIELLAWLVSTYELESEDILRHYDCGGKKCPLYYVDHEDAWRILKQDVAKKLEASK